MFEKVPNAPLKPIMIFFVFDEPIKLIILIYEIKSIKSRYEMYHLSIANAVTK